MSDTTELASQIQDAAMEPASATADGVTVTQNAPSEKIAAAKFNAAAQAGSRPPWGVQFGKIVSPGAQR